MRIASSRTRPHQTRIIRKDIRNVTAADFSGIDAVVHLAGLSNDPMGDINPACTYDINADATSILGLAAKEAGVSRFVFASSCSIYGAASPEDVLDESAEFNPVTPYGESKVRSEAILSQLASRDFSPVYLRNATAYGASPKLRADLMVNSLVGYAHLNGEVLIKSDGTPWRPLVHVEDICRAVVAALEAPTETVHDTPFNIGRSSENYQVKDVAEFVAQIVPDSRIVYEPGGGPDTRCYRVDFSKAENDLPGFEPVWTVPAGIEELLRSYRESDLKLNDFEGGQVHPPQVSERSSCGGCVGWRAFLEQAPFTGNLTDEHGCRERRGCREILRLPVVRRSRENRRPVPFRKHSCPKYGFGARCGNSGFFPVRKYGAALVPGLWPCLQRRV